MNPQTAQDLERLSAYLDNELSQADKAELEARLAREPQLKAGLDDLRQTVGALRGLPTVKPPRSFTLTPEQAGVRARRGPLFPVLRLSAALCTLLLVAALARDLVTSGGLGASPTTHTVVQGSATSTLLLPQAAPLQSPTPEISVETSGASAAAVTGTPAADLSTTPMLRMNTIEPSATAGPTLTGVAPSETPAAILGGGVTGPSTISASSTPEATAASAAALAPAATDTAVPAALPAPQPAAPAPISSLRVAEIVLAVLALVLAGATWLTRRA